MSSITRPCRPANGDGSGAPWCSLCLRAEGDKEDERYVGGDAQGGDGADGGCLDVGRTSQCAGRARVTWHPAGSRRRRPQARVGVRPWWCWRGGEPLSTCISAVAGSGSTGGWGDAAQRGFQLPAAGLVTAARRR